MAPFMEALAEEVLLKEDGPPALGLVYHLAGTAIFPIRACVPCSSLMVVSTDEWLTSA
jgi:hypothetical protein